MGTAWEGAPRYIHGKPSGVDLPAQEFTATLADADTTKPYAVEVYVGNDTDPVMSSSHVFDDNNRVEVTLGAFSTWYIVSVIAYCIVIVLLGVLVVRMWSWNGNADANANARTTEAYDAVPVGSGMTNAYDTTIVPPRFL